MSNSNQDKDKNKEKGFLKDEKGKKSAMRLMSFIALFAAILFGFLTLYKGAPEAGKQAVSHEGVFITIAFLIGAFAPKALQKFIEDNYGKKSNTQEESSSTAE